MYPYLLFPPSKKMLRVRSKNFVVCSNLYILCYLIQIVMEVISKKKLKKKRRSEHALQNWVVVLLFSSLGQMAYGSKTNVVQTIFLDLASLMKRLGLHIFFCFLFHFVFCMGFLFGLPFCVFHYTFGYKYRYYY